MEEPPQLRATDSIAYACPLLKLSRKPSSILSTLPSISSTSTLIFLSFPSLVLPPVWMAKLFPLRRREDAMETTSNRALTIFCTQFHALRLRFVLEDVSGVGLWTEGCREAVEGSADGALAFLPVFCRRPDLNSLTPVSPCRLWPATVKTRFTRHSSALSSPSTRSVCIPSTFLRGLR